MTREEIRVLLVTLSDTLTSDSDMQHESRGWGGLEVTVQCSAHLRRTRILVGEAKNADR